MYSTMRRNVAHKLDAQYLVLWVIYTQLLSFFYENKKKGKTYYLCVLPCSRDVPLKFHFCFFLNI